MRTFELNHHQKLILKDIKELPFSNLHYITIQQHYKGANLTLNELKKHIKRSVKEYVRRQDLQTYYEGKENETIKYYCFFENVKEFFLSQNTDILANEDFYSGFHCHIFISGVNEDYIKEIKYQLCSMKHKANCISKFSWRKLERLDEDFILYHTKQLQHRYSPQVILKNYVLAA